MSTLWLDFETKSRCDLKARGVYNYAQDLSTDVLCMAYAFDDEDVAIWTPDQPFPERVARHTGQIRAHNAAFERLIFWYVLQIDFALEQFYCTAAQARANCAPGSLEDVGRFASVDMRKDHRGAQLIRLLSIPRADGTFGNDPALLQEMYEYCAQDVRTMRAVSKAMRDMSADELADYHVNERINDRGVRVDVELCRAAQRYANEELTDIQRLVADITHGEITSVRSPKMREWVLARVGDEARKLMTVYKDDVQKYSIDKTVRANLLALAEENPDEIPTDVADVIQCADDLWASSVAKFSRLEKLADPEDGRVRGAFVFAGGSATGRASSYGAQVHNFTRKCAKEPENVRRSMVRGHAIVPAYGSRVTDVLKGMLRPALVPATGRLFAVADWSAIEGRVNPWLSNCPSGEEKLQAFRDRLDPYKVNASALYGVAYEDVTDAQRQVGKVQELACFAAETKVLTSNGVKPIVAVTLEDMLWDGTQWVDHQGVIARGLRRTINVCGMEVTPDHLIRMNKTWLRAQTLVSSKRCLTLALATGSANLPFLVPSTSSKARPKSGTQKYSATAGRRPIWSTSITFTGALQHDAPRALENRRATGVRIFTNTLKRVLTTSIDVACSIVFLHAKTAATIPATEGTQTTAVEVSSCTNLGLQTKPRFFGMFSRLTGGISRAWNLIGLMLTGGTNPAIFGSSQSKLTATTSGPSEKCKTASHTLKPVFDILNSGSLNRFTVITDEGPLIVHNCGFLGGAGSFETFGRVYGVRMTDSEIDRAVKAWRRHNQWAILHGDALERGYRTALRNRGHEIQAARVTYYFDGLHLWYALPSGRVLCYPYARFNDEGDVTYAKASWKPSADAKEWPRARLWRGLAVENVTQATAHDLLRHAMRQLEAEGLETVLHVHDELVVECDESSAEFTMQRLQAIMAEPPAWCADLPLTSEAKIMRRYGK